MSQKLIVLAPGGKEIFSADVHPPVVSPASCLMPREVIDGYEEAYREWFGITGGKLSLSWGGQPPTMRQVEPHVYEYRMSVTLAVARVGVHEIWRDDPLSARPVVFVLRTDLREG